MADLEDVNVVNHYTNIDEEEDELARQMIEFVELKRFFSGRNLAYLKLSWDC